MTIVRRYLFYPIYDSAVAFLRVAAFKFLASFSWTPTSRGCLPGPAEASESG